MITPDLPALVLTIIINFNIYRVIILLVHRESPQGKAGEGLPILPLLRQFLKSLSTVVFWFLEVE